MIVDTLRTTSIKQSEIQRNWHVVDAQGQSLGRLCSVISHYLRGKHKPNYTPHMDMGDCVVVINADKIHLTGEKWTKKTYFRHTGYIGNQKHIPIKFIHAKYPEEIIRKSVKGMLPKNKLGRQCARHLWIYRGSSHKHDAQCPKPLEIK